MTTRTALLSCALVFSSGVASGPPASGADEKPKVAPVTADLSGRWVYNLELSDDAREKMREGWRGGGPGAAVAGRPRRRGTGGPGGGGMGNSRQRMGPPGGMEATTIRASVRAILGRAGADDHADGDRDRGGGEIGRRGTSIPTGRSTRPTTAPRRSRPSGRTASSSSRRSGPGGAAWSRRGSSCPTAVASS
jgi:hypothetical protein